MRSIVVLITCLLGLVPNLALAQSELNFALLVFNGEQRQAYLDQVRRFEELHPEITVNIQGQESEQYKQDIEKWLTAEHHSDVMFWFGGERLNWYVSKGWVEPLDELWATNDWYHQITQSAQSSVTREGRIYGLPIHYYHWGIYYRKSLFEKLALTPPKTWAEFLVVCETLKKNNIAPIALGSSEGWPVAGWFDYLNLRINGLDFHQQLFSGEAHYKDPRLTPVFSTWQNLIKKDYFLANHAKLTWREALPYLYRNMAGMFLMGNFWTSQIPDSIRDDFSVFKFPIIDESISVYEEAPTDVLFIPKNAKNKDAAYKFLKFMARLDVQQPLNEALGMLAPLNVPPQKMDHFVQEGTYILQEADGASQFFDRDNPLPIAIKGMNELAEFMANPESLTKRLHNLEKLHEQSFEHH